jgi:hypothetical protein
MMMVDEVLMTWCFGQEGGKIEMLLSDGESDQG